MYCDVMMVKLSIASVEMPTIITSSVKAVEIPLKLRAEQLKNGRKLWLKNMVFAKSDTQQRSLDSAVNVKFLSFSESAIAI
jgi:hypothetical protein